MTEAERAASTRAHERYLKRLAGEVEAQERRMTLRSSRKRGFRKQDAIDLLCLGTFAAFWLSSFLEWWG